MLYSKSLEVNSRLCLASVFLYFWGAFTPQLFVNVTHDCLYPLGTCNQRSQKDVRRGWHWALEYFSPLDWASKQVRWRQNGEGLWKVEKVKFLRENWGWLSVSEMRKPKTFHVKLDFDSPKLYTFLRDQTKKWIYTASFKDGCWAQVEFYDSK